MHGLNLRKIMFLLLLIATSNSSFASDIYIYEDKDRILSPEKVNELFTAGKFKPLPQGDFNAGFTKSNFWLAIKPSGSATDQNLIVGNAHSIKPEIITHLIKDQSEVGFSSFHWRQI